MYCYDVTGVLAKTQNKGDRSANWISQSILVASILLVRTQRDTFLHFLILSSSLDGSFVQTVVSLKLPPALDLLVASICRPSRPALRLLG